MINRRTKVAIAAIAGLSILAACSKPASTEAPSAPEAAAPAAEEALLPNGLTAKVQIETRQAQLKKLGKAFKMISDQLKSGSPDVAAIQEAAASVPVESAGMEDWFPEGTGPDAGVKTDALPVIWEDRADFEQKIADFRAASDTLAATAAGGDLAAIGAAFGETGGTCKSCHQKFRADD